VTTEFQIASLAIDISVPNTSVATIQGRTGSPRMPCPRLHRGLCAPSAVEGFAEASFPRRAHLLQGHRVNSGGPPSISRWRFRSPSLPAIPDRRGSVRVPSAPTPHLRYCWATRNPAGHARRPDRVAGLRRFTHPWFIPRLSGCAATGTIGAPTRLPISQPSPIPWERLEAGSAADPALSLAWS
jgi:hypothetical protein